MYMYWGEIQGYSSLNAPILEQICYQYDKDLHLSSNAPAWVSQSQIIEIFKQFNEILI